MNDVTIGNPQGTVTAREIGWIAGIIDGEGTIVLFLIQHKGKIKGVGPQVIMANTDKAIVDRYADIMKRAGVGFYYSKRIQKPVTGIVGQKPITKKYKDLYRVSTVGYRRVKKLLDLVVDDLVGDKQHKARVMLRLINYRLLRYSGGDGIPGKAAPFDHQDLVLIKEFCKLMKSKHEHLIDGLLRDSEQQQPLILEAV